MKKPSGRALKTLPRCAACPFPLAGDEIQGAGGVRKLRIALKGMGKRSGARVIYYWYSDDAPIYALLVYGKNEKINLSAAEKAVVRAFAKAIKATKRSGKK